MSEPSAAAPPEGEKLSKNALKKLQKDKEKAEKKAAAKKADEENKPTSQVAVQEDTAKDNYGILPSSIEAPTITRLKDLKDGAVGEEITVVTRVHNSRSQSAKLAFLMLRQQGETIQAVLAVGGGESISRQMVKWSIGIHINSFVRVSGLVIKPQTPIASASLSGLELHVTKIYMISEASEQIPIQVRDLERPNGTAEEEAQQAEGDKEGESLEVPTVTLTTRLDNRPIDLQTKCNQAIFRISHRVEMLFQEYLSGNDFLSVHTPKLLGVATEGGSSVFEVSNYFGKKAYLAQSPQFHKQMLIAGDFERVFEVGPVFRAENSNSHRHLTEFMGLDFEMVFNNHYHEVLGFAEEMIIYIIKGLQEQCKSETSIVKEFFPKAGDFRIAEDGKALRLTYLEGVKILKEAGIDTSEQDSFVTDLTTAMEKRLGELIRQKYNTDFYVLDEFPMSVRPFYTKSCPHDKDLSNSYDFFMRGEEIMSGAQRINDPEELMAAMKAKGVDPDQEGFEDYINAFRQGCRPHAGGGLGLNRIVQFFLGLPNIRQATAFPRDPQRLRP